MYNGFNGGMLDCHVLAVRCFGLSVLMGNSSGLAGFTEHAFFFCGSLSASDVSFHSASSLVLVGGLR